MLHLPGARRGRAAMAAALIACSTLVATVGGRSPGAGASGPNLGSVQLALAPVTTGLSSPVDLAWRSGDGRMYVVELGGTVVIVSPDGSVSPTPVLDVSADLGSGSDEQGLLGVTFSSDGTKLYVDYVDSSWSIEVVEYTMSGDVADTSTKRVLLTIPHADYSNHYGGEVIFGPDGDLYIGTGDGGGAGDPLGNAQNKGSLLGKILRINPAPSNGLPYTIPADNPFVGQAGVRPEIWMYGLRNPWRFSFDRQTGQLWIGDVGQDDVDPVLVVGSGRSGL